MDFTPTKAAVDAVIQSMGTSCKVTKVDGTTATTVGVLLTSESKSSPDSYISSKERVVYLSGKLKFAPKAGDTVTFAPNIYAINSVRAIAVGEGNKSVFAYRLTVGTS